MYDRLIDSNNSNDEREQNRFRNSHTKGSGQKNPIRTGKKKTGKPKIQTERQSMRTMRPPYWTRQHVCPEKKNEYKNCKSRGHYEKMCRSMKRVQCVKRTTPSAEQDDGNYNKIQKINDAKQMKSYYNATLLVNNVPSHFIIDSRSTDTLFSESFFNSVSNVEPLKTTYKDMNNQNNDFTGQTKAVVKQ